MSSSRPSKRTSVSSVNSMTSINVKSHNKREDDSGGVGGAAEDDDDYGDEDECDDPTVTLAPLMDSCLASHEFEWLKPSSSSLSATGGGSTGKEFGCEMEERSAVSAAIPPQPQHKSSKKSNSHYQRRPKERDYMNCRMSPTACYESTVCHHRLSPMRSSWCCPSPPPPVPSHISSVPMCLHRAGSAAGIEIVPCSQECCTDEPGFGTCYCFPPNPHQHSRCGPPCICHHYSPQHYAECSPGSPQHFYRTTGQRSHSVGSRRREFSPSSSPLHRPYFSADASGCMMPSRNSANVWEEQWKPPIHSEDSSNLLKIQQLESEKKNLILQVSVLNDQVDAQAEKIRELEGLLDEKQSQLHHLEQELHQEVMTRSAVENGKLELMTEISNLRLRLTAAERDRKESDEKYRRIESNLNARISENDLKSSLYISKTQNGALLSQVDANAENEKLHLALDTVMASNEEKDKKIEDLRLALVKYKKLHDLVLAGQKKDFSMKETQVGETEILRDSPLYASAGESPKVKLSSKPPSGQRGHVTTVMTASVHCDPGNAGDSARFSPTGSHSLPRSSSLENLRHQSSKVQSSETPYGTMPRQSGQLVLQHLQEQLQKHESSAPSSPTHVKEVPASPTPSSTSAKQRIRLITEEPNRTSRNKSSGVSFGKGFFKLRLGKRSSSAPELAPFDNAIILDREASSATPTPQPTMQPFFIKPEKERSKNILKFFTKWKRSGSQNIEKIEGDFRRGGVRATAGPRLGWSREISINLDIPFSNWNNDVVVEWFHKVGLSMYISELKRWRCSGERLLNSTPQELEKELNLKHPLHKKKLTLALQGFKGDSLPSNINSLDYQWVVRWLDDVGLPQYKDSFSESRVDGRVLHYLTVDDLLYLKVTNQLHHISIKRGIQVLREKNFDPHCLIRRSLPDEDKSFTPESVSLWTNHRVMEWLRTVDLSEYAPNLRGSGVHGALIIYEPKFNSDLFATLLNIPPTKTLLRRHLATHFKTIVGADYIQVKRDMETDQLNMPLTPNVKIKNARKPQFVLKKKRGKSENESEEFVCPMDIPVGSDSVKHGGEKLVVRRNSDPAPQESRILDSQDEKTAEEIGAVSKEITSLTAMLQEEKLLKNAPSTNV